jgi:hypothetical protein
VTAPTTDSAEEQSRAEPDTTPKKAGLLLVRAIRKRCPNCGRPNVFEGYFTLKQRCPRCGILLERGEGDYFRAQPHRSGSLSRRRIRDRNGCHVAEPALERASIRGCRIGRRRSNSLLSICEDDLAGARPHFSTAEARGLHHPLQIARSSRSPCPDVRCRGRFYEILTAVIRANALSR